MSCCCLRSRGVDEVKGELKDVGRELSVIDSRGRFEGGWLLPLDAADLY